MSVQGAALQPTTFALAFGSVPRFCVVMSFPSRATVCPWISSGHSAVNACVVDVATSGVADGFESAAVKSEEDAALRLKWSYHGVISVDVLRGSASQQSTIPSYGQLEE